MTQIPEMVARWLQKERESLIRQQQMLEDGSFRTNESRGGRPVDTSVRALADVKQKLAELNEILGQDGS